jgi:hypothetical protein
MARFEITAPDGKRYEVTVPDGTTGEQAMAYMQKQTAQETVPEGAGRFAPSPNAGLAIPEANPVADVAKGAGVGLARGALGMVGLPGTVEQLGRMGINYGAQALGAKGEVVSPETALPTGGDLQKRVEKHTGKFYEPQTTAGKYARTIGEFAPGLAFPGGAVQRVLGNVVGPAVASETAGQMTEGTALEPYARVGGALVGGGLPGVLSRGYTPVPTDPTRAAHVQNLRNEGVNALTAGQVTGSTPLRYLEQHAADIPFSGGRARTQADQAAEQFTAAALRRAGVNSPRATQDVIDNAFTTQGQRFDNLANASTLVLNRVDRRGMANAVQGYAALTPPSQRAPIIAEFFNDVDQLLGRQVPGAVYQRYRSLIETTARQTTDPALAEGLRGLRNVLDDAVERGLPANQRGQWQQARTEYRNLLTVSRAAGAAGEGAANGLISPAQLAAAAKSTQGARNFERGRGELQQLARSGQAVMSGLPNSGTPARLAAQSIGAGVGGLAAGAPGMLMAPIGSALAARTFMSPGMQRYLGANARGAPMETSALQGGLSAVAAALASASNRPPLEVTIYPQGDPRNSR